MTSRERFEAWVKEQLREQGWHEESAILVFNPSRISGRTYSDSATESMWKAWQAAEAEAARRCAEIAQDKNPWPSHHAADAIKAEFPEAFK